MKLNIKPLFHLLLAFFAFLTLNSFARTDEIYVLSDIVYGNSEQQVLDVYYSSTKKENAPVIFMVHGGAWRVGDKASRSVVKNKVAHWVSKGFIFVSVNYRMLPNVRPVEQAGDVEKALLFSQEKAREWGGSSEKFILMGHSAGAHLISLVSVGNNAKIKPWLGTIALDSAAYDVTKIMSSKSSPRFYKKAFGKNPMYWKKASPVFMLAGKIPPFLAVCSSNREDGSCSQARSFIAKAKNYGSHAKLLSAPLSHRKINIELGRDTCYTREVDEFIRKLHPSIEPMLASESTSRLRSRAQRRCTGL